MNKNIIAHHTVTGDIKEILKRLNPMLPQLEHEEWLAESNRIKTTYPLKYPTGVLTTQYVMERLSALTNRDALIVTEVGQHQMWAAQFYQYKFHRQLMTSGGLGAMGYGLGASIGVACGRNDKKIINVAGDGCFRMNLNELATVSRYQLPIIELVVNNQVLGMVRQWQTLFYGQRYSNTTLTDATDYVKVAEAFGIKGLRITCLEEVDAVLTEALNMNAPVLIDLQVGENDMVSPMIAPGGSISDALEV